MSTATILQERRVRVADLPDYVGWSLQGDLSNDAVARWGKIIAAEQIEVDTGSRWGMQPRMSVTHERTLRGTTVPDSCLFALETPTGDHHVTVCRSVPAPSCECGAVITDPDETACLTHRILDTAERS